MVKSGLRHVQTVVQLATVNTGDAVSMDDKAWRVYVATRRKPDGGFDGFEPFFVIDLTWEDSFSPMVMT